jgi:hypothetical protein
VNNFNLFMLVLVVLLAGCRGAGGGGYYQNQRFGAGAWYAPAMYNGGGTYFPTYGSGYCGSATEHVLGDGPGAAFSTDRFWR